MKITISCVLTTLGGMGILCNAMAESETNPTSAPLIAEHKNTVTLNFGTYNLANHSQDWNIVGPAYSGGCFMLIICTGPGHSWSPLSNEFDTSSRDVFGIGYEREIKHGFSFGIDYFQIKNSFVIPSITPSQGEVTTKFYFIAAKKYFGAPGGFRPFIGLGVGQVSAKISGYVNRSASGSAAEAMLGLSYQTGRSRFAAGYRFVNTNIVGGLDSSAFNTGEVFGSLDLRGSGYFVGLGVGF